MQLWSIGAYLPVFVVFMLFLSFYTDGHISALPGSCVPGLRITIHHHNNKRQKYPAPCMPGLWKARKPGWWSSSNRILQQLWYPGKELDLSKTYRNCSFKILMLPFLWSIIFSIKVFRPLTEPLCLPYKLEVTNKLPVVKGPIWVVLIN